MGPSSWTTKGVGGGSGLDKAAGCRDCICPKGAGTTMPLCARGGSGAGALVRWPLVDVGQGGRGVLPQALNNSAANAIDVFQ